MFIVRVLVIVCLASVCFGGEAASLSVEDSLVLVTTSSPKGNRGGNGFVIGDGTLVVTARHLIFESSDGGRHEMAGLVKLFSPYLGDACDAEIIAVDEVLDIAVLKVNWYGHPALKLADDITIMSAERIEVVGMPAVIDTMGPKGSSATIGKYSSDSEKLDVGFVAVRRSVPQYVSLAGTGKLRQGWSGSPMVIAGTLEAAGCFASLQGTLGLAASSSIGGAASQITRLLEKTDELKSLLPAKEVTARPVDGVEIFVEYLRTYRHYMEDNYALAADEVQSLIRKRPESAFSYTLAASVAAKQGKHDAAEKNYQKALKLNAEGSALKTLYAQYLSGRDADKALEMLEGMLGKGRVRETAIFLMFNILSERGEFQRCSELLSDAVKVNGRNAYLWVNLWSCQLQLSKTNDAIDSLIKAVDLMPETGPFRGGGIGSCT